MKKFRLMMIAAALFAVGSAFTTTKKLDCGYVFINGQWIQQTFGVDYRCDFDPESICTYNENHDECEEGEYIPL